MINFDIAFDRLLGHEGGYSNDPRDPGGETNWGISKRSYPNVDIKNLTKEAAKVIYKRDYWDAAKATQYHPAIGFQVFDLGVNGGPGASARILQRAVGVLPDGQIGPMTLAAINKFSPLAVCIKFNLQRVLWHRNDNNWTIYGEGWTNRVAVNVEYAMKDCLLDAPGT